MHLRAFALLLSTLALAACVPPAGYYGGAYSGPQLYGTPPYGAQPSPGRPPGSPPGPPSGAPMPPGGPAGEGPGGIALLVPLTGSNAQIGQAMVKAAQLALDGPEAQSLHVRDTGGTADGAAEAARQAVTAGDRLILGPLTAADATAAAGPAQAAGLPVLAFTSDPAVARPGVWVLGLTPDQQVRRLVGLAATRGRSRLAALLPENDFGRAMADALNRAAGAASLPPPAIQLYGPGSSAVAEAVRALADPDHRRAEREERLKAARDRGPEGAADLAALTADPPGPAFDTLLVGATAARLGEIGVLLGRSGVDKSQVQIIGPALWAQPAARYGAMSTLNGAWYAAPDPDARAGFATLYRQRYGAAPPSLADLAYDAAAMARVMARQGGYSQGSLTRAEGFAGADGVFGLLPDGRVRRALAVFEIRNNAPAVLDPAPRTLGGPGT